MVEFLLLRNIKSIEFLYEYFKDVMSVEYVIIFFYLIVFYFFKFGLNLEVFYMICIVVVEEMLYLILVVNVFNVVGGNIY